MSLEIGQLEIIDWHKAFESPGDKQAFVDKANLVGTPYGMLSVTSAEVDEFLAAYVLKSWTGEVVGITACKQIVQKPQMFVKEHGALMKLMPTATIGTTVLTKYKGNNLATSLVAHATAAAFGAGAEICVARSASPSCIKIYEKLGYNLGGVRDDGKHDLALLKDAWNILPPKILFIDPPTFTDGGRYD
jgi:hypothetical protein